MEIRVLRYFLAIAREESITSAAARLHITQPTLSRQIKDLEDQLGQKLFLREKHRMTLTAEGMLLRKRAEEILDLVDKTEAEFSAMEESVSGSIYIGSGETDAMRLIADVIRGLQETFPSIHFHLYSGNAEDVTEKLEKGLLDFGILIEPADLSKYSFIQLPVSDTWGVVMRKDSPLAQKEQIRKEDLLSLPLICSRQVITKDLSDNPFAQWFGEDFGKLNITATYNLFYNAAVMTRAGAGYAVTLDKLADTSESSELCFRPLYPRLEAGLNIVWKKYQVFSSAAQLFLERLQDRFGEAL